MADERDNELPEGTGEPDSWLDGLVPNHWPHIEFNEGRHGESGEDAWPEATRERHIEEVAPGYRKLHLEVAMILWQNAMNSVVDHLVEEVSSCETGPLLGADEKSEAEDQQKVQGPLQVVKNWID